MLIIDRKVIDSLPESERKFESVIWHQSDNLEAAVDYFSAALSLFDRCEAEPAAKESKRGWKFIAARDGGITLWNFWLASHAVKHNLMKAPTLRAAVNMGAVEAALKRLQDAYPNGAAKAVRDAIVHPSDMFDTPRELTNNATKPVDIPGLIKSEGSGAVVSGNLKGRKYLVSTFGGKTVGYDLSDATLSLLSEVQAQIFSAFPSGRR